MLDNTPGRRDKPHHHQLEAVIAQHPDRFQFVGEYPKPGEPSLPGEDVKVYRVVDAAHKPVGKIRIDMRHMLNRSIEN